jgi:hypothetical protein
LCVLLLCESLSTVTLVTESLVGCSLNPCPERSEGPRVKFEF